MTEIYSKKIKFPPYTYIPKINHHPIKHKLGHSYNNETIINNFNPNNWQNSKEYLKAIDFFNHNFFWEAHELWEGIWNYLNREGKYACLLQLLIKLTAAGVKFLEGRKKGTVRHCKFVSNSFNKYKENKLLGLNIKSLIPPINQIILEPELILNLTLKLENS